MLFTAGEALKIDSTYFYTAETMQPITAIASNSVQITNVVLFGGTTVAITSPSTTIQNTYISFMTGGGVLIQPIAAGSPLLPPTTVIDKCLVFINEGGLSVGNQNDVGTSNGLVTISNSLFSYNLCETIAELSPCMLRT